MTNFWNNKRVLVTGATGFVGNHLCKALSQKSGIDLFEIGSDDYDLRYQSQHMFQDFGSMDIVFNLAANVGGIGYNQNNSYQLFYDNLLINTSMIDKSIKYGVSKFIQLGTVCSYPKFAPIPFSEFDLWNGYPEETNAPYGIAKKAALIQLQSARKDFDFNGIYLIPTNLYGPGDEFESYKSHVVAALIKKFSKAKQTNAPSVEIWGTGTASRDFLYISDAIEAIILAAERYDRPEPLNVGSGEETNIKILAHMIQEIIEYKGDTVWDRTRPDGQPRRRLSIRKIKWILGWSAKISIKDGLRKTIEWYQEEELIAA